MKRWAGLLLVVVAAQSALAGEGTSGAASLKLAAGARGQAMAEAFSASADGVEALFWNPAGLSQSDGRSFLLGFQPMLDSSMAQAAAGGRFGRLGLGLGFNGLRHDELTGYDDVGNQTEDFKAQDQTFLAGAAWQNGRTSFGVVGKYWNSKIDGESASAFAADVGLGFPSPFTKRAKHALVVRNLGGDVSYVAQKDPLPMTVVLGNSFPAGKRVLLNIDGGWQQDASMIWAGGLEWAAVRGDFLEMALRGGYTNRRNEADGLSGASFGFGLTIKSVAVDYAWIPFGELGDSHSVTLLWRVSSNVLHLKRRQSRSADKPALAPAKSTMPQASPSGRKKLDQLESPRRKQRSVPPRTPTNR